MRSRYCKVCGDFHDVDAPWPEACYRHKASGSIQIIKDIDPYRSVASDVNGKQARIGSRREHREFLKRNNYIEVGNEPLTRPKLTERDYVSNRDVKAAIDQLRSRR